LINDRLTRGIIAGAVGAVVQNIYIYAAQMMGFTTTNYGDYSEILFFSKLLPGFFPNFFGIIGHFVWDTFLGVVFAYGIKYTSSRFYVLKGLVYGAFIWWIVNVICKLFRIPVFSTLPYQELGVFLVGALLFGFIAAFTLRMLDSRWEGVRQK